MGRYCLRHGESKTQAELKFADTVRLAQDGSPLKASAHLMLARLDNDVDANIAVAASGGVLWVANLSHLEPAAALPVSIALFAGCGGVLRLSRCVYGVLPSS